MGMPNDSDLIGRQLRSMQIIVVALAMGVLIFLGCVVTNGGNVQGQLPQWFLPFVIVPFGGAVLLTFLLAPYAMTRVVRGQIARSTTPVRPETSGGETEKLLNLYLARGIIRAALLESVAFLLLVVYMMDPNQWYIVGAAVLAGGIVALFPTRTGVENWLDSQKQSLAEERMRGRAR